MQTRTFTEPEARVLCEALLAARRSVSADDRQIIDGILRDGWDDWVNEPIDEDERWS